MAVWAAKEDDVGESLRIVDTVSRPVGMWLSADHPDPVSSDQVVMILRRDPADRRGFVILSLFPRGPRG